MYFAPCSIAKNSSILDLKKEGTSRKYWKGSAEEKNRCLTLPIKYDLKPARVQGAKKKKKKKIYIYIYVFIYFELKSTSVLDRS